MHLEPIQYRCYRQFLLDWIELHKLSYRSFSAKFSSYISFPFLSKLLRRNSEGQFTRDVSLRAEKLAALLRAMGLGQTEISHLVLCRLEGDKWAGSYKYSSAFSETLKSLNTAGKNSSPSAKIVEALESLIISRRQKVIEELKAQLEIEISRASSALKVQKLKNLMEEL